MLISQVVYVCCRFLKKSDFQTVCIMREPPYKNDCLVFNTVNRSVNSTYKANVFNKLLISLTNLFVNVYVATDISMNSNTIICGKVHSGKHLYHLDQSVDLQC